jgi:aspartyl-tRNA(Asn)/glutamyl-tRNA(Gln) amidotransferase subunit C
MSASTDLNIDHVANLARIALTAEEKAKFAQQLGEVIHHIEQLRKVDVSGVEPTAHAFPVHNVWSEDVARPGLPVEAALRNAPAQRDNMIVVPKVVE